MFQLALPAVLFRFTYEAPHFAPLLQLPPTRATAREREAQGLGRAQCPIDIRLSKICSVRGIAPPVPLGAYAPEGCSQESEAPMLQLAVPAGLPRYTYEAPHCAPRPQLPPTRATATIVVFTQK